MKKKFYTLTYGLSIMFCMGLVGLTSCSKDDDDPEPEPALPVLSFKTEQVIVNEADGVIEVEVVLDQPAPADLTIDFLVGGSVNLDPEEGPVDVYFADDHFAIAKGATSGKLELEIAHDLQFEGTEALLLQLDEVNGAEVEISRNDQTVVGIQQEDGYVIQLFWDKPNAETGKFADMDLVLRYEDEEEGWVIADFSIAENPSGSEFVFLPNAANGTFGLSYVYWGGNLNPLDFDVVFREFSDGTLEDLDDVSESNIYQGSYTLANINKWDDEEDLLETTQVVQTVTIDDGDFDVSDIEAPAAGSRIGQLKTAKMLKKPARIPYEGSRQQKLDNGINF